MKKTLLFIAFLTLIAMAIVSCAGQKNGCNATRGMSGFK